MAVFLERAPPADTLAGIRGQRDEQIELGRREIYIHYGQGMGTSKLIIAAAKTGTRAQYEYRCDARPDGCRGPETRNRAVKPPRDLASPTSRMAAGQRMREAYRIIGADPPRAPMAAPQGALRPTLKLRLTRKNPEIGNLVEHIEIAKYRRRTPRRQREASPSNHGAAATRDSTRAKRCSSCDVLAFEGCLVGRCIKARDIAENRRSKFNPGAMLGAGQRIGGMQRFGSVSSRYARMTRGLENRDVADQKHRRPAEAAKAPENHAGLLARSISIRSNKTPFSVSASPRAAHRDRACG